MLGAGAEDNLEWLAERYPVTLSKSKGTWNLDLGWSEIPEASFVGVPDLGILLAAAREWDETPAGERLDGDDWLRLCAAAAQSGKSTRDLMRQGARELLDRIAGDAANPAP